MPLDFPASPITGATYTAPNGTIWVWDGAKWANGVYIGTAYAPINAPTFTGDARAVTPPAGDADTSIATTAFVRAGTTTNDNAAAGQVGEFISSNVTSAVSLVSGAYTNVTSISLTAGDWDAWGVVGFTTSGATTFYSIISTISSNSAALPSEPFNNGGAFALIGMPPSTLMATGTRLPTGTMRASIAAPTTFYLVANAGFTAAGTVTAFGFIGARRVR